MASLTTRENGDKEIRTVPALGRKTIRLPRKTTARQARAVLSHIEHLESQAITGHPAPDATQRWLGLMAQKKSEQEKANKRSGKKSRNLPMYDKLVKAGLAKDTRHYTLGEWIEHCIKQTAESAVAGTITRLRQSKKAAVAYFGEDRSMPSITVGDAEDYERAIYGGDISKATARKRLADCKQWLGRAVKHKHIDTNPMDSIRGTVPPTENLYYVAHGKSVEVMNELPTTVLAAVFALSRWGGLRTPSEHARMGWADINWNTERFTVHGKGGRDRIVPLFPELVTPLYDLYEITAPGTVEVFPGLSPNASAFQGPLRLAITRAGHTAWPRLLHNLRATRITELIDRYGLEKVKTVASWMGNSPEVIMKNYIIEHEREADFKRAVEVASAARCAPSTGVNRHQPPSKTPATGPEKADTGVQSDPYGIRTAFVKPCLDHYLRAFNKRYSAHSAPLRNRGGAA